MPAQAVRERSSLTGFTAEVLLTKPEIIYDIERIIDLIDVSYEKIH